MRPPVLLAAALAYTSVATAVAAPPPAEVRVYESEDDDEMTEGDTTIRTDPDTAYAAASDYQRWASIFPDIARVAVTAQRGTDARVTFTYADDHKDNLHFRNVPTAHKVWFEDTGGRAEVWGDIVFTPGTAPGTTHVHSRVYADVKGVTGWFVSDGKLRRLRTERVRGDLEHLRAYFASQAVARATP